MEEKFFHHALKIDASVCIGCTHCLKVCPTEAIRIREGKAVIFDNRCIDCGECLRICPVNAIGIEQDDFKQIFNFNRRVVLIPSVFIGQFNERISTIDITKVLLHIGFTDIFKIEHSVEVLLPEQKKYIEEHSEIRPLIPSFCPAIVRLIQIRFPSLVKNIILQKPPLEISAFYYRKKLINAGVAPRDIGIFYVTPCAAKIASVKSPIESEKTGIDGVINMNELYNMVNKLYNQGGLPEWQLNDSEILSSEGLRWSLTEGEAHNIEGRSLAIDGIHNVISFLEQVENEEISDIDFLELRACDQSCAGGVLTPTNRFLTRERLMHCVEKRLKIADKEAHDVVNYGEALSKFLKIAEIKPRSMLSLDEDVNKAMEKYELIKCINAKLPQTDCGFCGSPNCRAFAEDVVNKRSEMEYCPFMRCSLSDDNKDLNETNKIKCIASVWGFDKFKKSDSL